MSYFNWWRTIIFEKKFVDPLPNSQSKQLNQFKLSKTLLFSISYGRGKQKRGGARINCKASTTIRGCLSARNWHKRGVQGVKSCRYIWWRRDKQRWEREREREREREIFADVDYSFSISFLLITGKYSLLRRLSLQIIHRRQKYPSKWTWTVAILKWRAYENGEQIFEREMTLCH